MKYKNYLNIKGKFSQALCITTIFFCSILLSGCHSNQPDLEYSKASSSGVIPIETMDAEQVPLSGISLGGIGAGSVELRKDGVFYNWQIANNLPRGTGIKIDWIDNANLFFIVRFQEEGKEPRLKLLQIENGLNVAALLNHQYSFPWISGIKNTTYQGQFPFIYMTFKDPDMPFDIDMEAFTPFIPHDVKNSTLPGIYFNFKIKAKTDKPVDVMLMASYRNLAGYDTDKKNHRSGIEGNENFKTSFMTCEKMDTSASSFGSVAMSSLSKGSCYYLGWEHLHPYYEYVLRNDRLPNVNDTEGRNNKSGIAMKRCFSSIAQSTKLLPKTSFDHSFVYAWNFPNLYNEDHSSIEGNYYNNYFKNAQEVAAYMIQNKAGLTERSHEFVDNFYASTLQPFILNQINSQLNTFITSTYINKAGDFGILEGMDEDRSCCGVTTIDVSMYGSVMIASLFPEFELSTMKFHRSQQRPNGLILHSLSKDYACAKTCSDGACCAKGEATNRLDLPAQYVLLILRDYFWTNDKKFLSDSWPSIKKAIDYVIKERDRNGDQLPDMEGIMSSYDNFPMYGDASYILSQWNACMAGAARAADIMGDKEAHDLYSKILERGKKVYEDKLWNGKYFRLYNNETGDNKGKDEGCLTDQMIGQWACDMCGLERIIDQEKVKQAMVHTLELSYKPDFGLRNCSWPGDPYWHDVAKDSWVDQGNTCWTGVELAYASFLIYEGMYNEGINVIKTVDDRYRKAGIYWNHMECGGHYFRPMAAWSILNALLGLGINQEVFSFDPQLPGKEYTVFFAFPSGTAHFISKSGIVEIKILPGELKCKELDLANVLAGVQNAQATVNNMKFDSKSNQGKLSFDFAAELIIKAGESIIIK
jgi:uncharacterized protein (DUF608 family)